MLAINLLRESNIKSQVKKRKAIFFHGILSRNISMHRLFENIKKAAQTDVSIYIFCETGVGKELVARAIHAESERAQQPFVAVNVANFSSDLIESQLFGHKKVAFTGAINNSAGLMQTAANGTLFLDEVTSLPTNTQAKLLRVLQERQYYPVGDVKLQEFNASIVSASNMSFEEAIEFHQFRKDLRYRLEVIPLKVPALRESRDDIILLFTYFLKLASNGKEWKIDKLLAKKLKQYSWPGNVRELVNCARFAVAMANQWQVEEEDEQSLDQRSQSSKKEEREVLEYGVKMEIIPYIIDSDTVTLKIIDASVSDLVVGGNGYLQLIKHKVSNQVTVNNGEFILLGGMMQQSSVKHNEGMPKLKELPLLGWLFGQRKQRNSDYEVWIMIRPSILGKN